MHIWAELSIAMSENPEARPTAHNLHKLLDSSEASVLERMMKRLMDYAQSLELAVDQRTFELTEEQKQTDRILLQMLPRYNCKGKLHRSVRNVINNDRCLF